MGGNLPILRSPIPGMADAELKLLTGHSKRETLAIYQHIALDGELEPKYQQAMKETGL